MICNELAKGYAFLISVCFYILKVFLKKIKFFYYLKLIFFLVFLDNFNTLMS